MFWLLKIKTPNRSQMKKIILTIAILTLAIVSNAQRGTKIKIIASDKMEPLTGASIYLMGKNLSFVSDKNGYFFIPNIDGVDTLVVTFIGYKSKKIAVFNGYNINIHLAPTLQNLQEVIISTGYQTISSERITGSVFHIDNNLINQRVGTNIIDRLENNVSGLIFNRVGTNNTNQSQISIRGQSTLNAKTDPLIVLDNFPFEGNLNDINPNDVESISILKDASAASIWGAKAGNGVIVITTKKGKVNQMTKVSFNSNLTIGARPDLFYVPKMSSADYIEIERTLFKKGYYNSIISSPTRPVLTPGVELMISNPSDLEAKLTEFKNYDVRNDFEDHYYRNSLNQQYALNITGGTENQQHFLSAGYDKNQDNLIQNGYQRFSLNANNTYRLLKGRLEINTSIWYTQSITSNPNTGISGVRSSASSPLYPYARLIDNDSNRLSIGRDYRLGFIEDARANGLLDWSYSPLDDIEQIENKQNGSNFRVNTGLNLKILDGLNASIFYQYNRNSGNSDRLQGEQSYFTRNLINSFSIRNINDGSVDRLIPLGGILEQTNLTSSIHNIRGQLNYNNSWKGVHELIAMTGYEIESKQALGNIHRTYGFDEAHGLNKPVNYNTPYTSYVNPNSTTNYIPFLDSQTSLTDRYISYYANALYTYLKRYSLYGSFRLDKSNLFGVNANQKGIPLWSLGLSWDISKEKFYNFDATADLKLRITYGYSGNVDKSVSAYTTARYLSNAVGTQLRWAQIINPPNPELRWERVKILNVGIDFRLKNDRINGTLEIYSKKGLDLIGIVPYAPSTGITSFRSNNANTSGYGTDITLSSKNINHVFKWHTTILYSLIREKVTKYGVKASGSQYVRAIGYPLAGKPYYSLYSYRWAGLDPNTGDPIGYLNGEVSKNYSQITSSKPEDLEFNGSARPTSYGSLRNTFIWKGLSLSANISYRLGYYFRNNSIRYSDNLALDNQHGDYSRRWQNAGDEKLTNVPSIPLTSNLQRDDFYNYSEVLIERADHIRLQDMTLGYEINNTRSTRLPLTKIRFYLYANNLGIIWKKSDGKLDPDYLSVPPPPKTLAFGIQVDL